MLVFEYQTGVKAARDTPDSILACTEIFRIPKGYVWYPSVVSMILHRSVYLRRMSARIQRENHWLGNDSTIENDSSSSRDSVVLSL